METNHAKPAETSRNQPSEPIAELLKAGNVLSVSNRTTEGAIMQLVITIEAEISDPQVRDDLVTALESLVPYACDNVLIRSSVSG